MAIRRLCARARDKFSRRCLFSVTLACCVALACFSAARHVTRSTPRSSERQTLSFRTLFKPSAALLRSDRRDSCSNVDEGVLKKPSECSTMLQHNASNVRTSTQPVHVYVHVTNTISVEAVLLDILFAFHSSGLLSVAERINICVSGVNMEGLGDILAGFQRELDTGRIRLFHVATDPSTFELPTINKLLRFAREVVNQGTDAHILYVHTKGLLAKTGSFVPKWYWRKTMQFWLIEHHEHCRRMLHHGYDTVGVNPVRGVSKRTGKAVVNRNNVHYSGNFWWARAKHVARLPERLAVRKRVDPVERFQAENLILSEYPNMCAGVVYDWGSSHMYKKEEIPSMEIMKKLSPRCDIL